MKCSRQTASSRPSPHWNRFAMATLMAIALAGCGGGDGSPGSNWNNGTNGVNGANGTNGSNGKDASTAVNVGSNTVAASTATSIAWAALAPQVSVTSVTIASAPVVKFTVKDAAGNPVLGLASKAQSATATVPGLTNIAFTPANLVPGNTLSAIGKTANAEPSKWVSYLVTRPPTVAEKTTPPATSFMECSDGCDLVRHRPCQRHPGHPGRQRGWQLPVHLLSRHHTDRRDCGQPDGLGRRPVQEGRHGRPELRRGADAPLGHHHQRQCARHEYEHAECGHLCLDGNAGADGQDLQPGI